MAAAMMCFAAATTAVAVLASADHAAPVMCQACAQGFADAGGCKAVSSGLDPMPMVPEGCAEQCGGHEMGQMCWSSGLDPMPMVPEGSVANSSLPEFSLATARAFASLAEASYCGPIANLTSWNCDPCKDSGLKIEPKPGYNDSVLTVQDGAFWDVFSKFAYVARLGPNTGLGPFANGCVLSVRGSNNKANFIKDIEVTRKAMHLCKGCTATHGFNTLWHEIADDIIKKLAQIGCEPGGDPLFITGHSLGAAVATIAAVELVAMGFDIRAAYLFESPRVGNEAFAEFFNSHFRGKDVWRITHGRDPIPSAPYGFGYTHTGQEVFFDSNDEHHVCSSYQECEQHKPYFRLNPADHCRSPLVPQKDSMGGASDMCNCRDWKPLGQSVVV